MSKLSRYIIRQVAGPLGFFTLLLTGVIWLSQSLKILDLVVNRGQSIITFMKFNAFIFPGVLALVIPIALFCAVLYAVNRLQNDSELVVLWAAGLSRWSLLKPILVLSGFVALLVLAINLYFAPLGLSAMRGYVIQIRSDIATTLLKEGAFSTPINGLTVYIREQISTAEFTGLMVHDNRDEKNPITYMAERGKLIQTEEGPRLVMVNGNIQKTSSAQPGQLSLLYFDKYTFDLSQYISPESEVHWKQPKERFLDELFWPEDNRNSRRYYSRLITEGHNRLATPLYVFAFAMIGVAALLYRPVTRSSPAVMIAGGVFFAIVVRLAGLGATSLAKDNQLLLPLLYLVPIFGTIIPSVMVTGLLSRYRRERMPVLSTPAGE